MTIFAKILFIFTSFGPLWLLMALRFGAVDTKAPLASTASTLAWIFYGAAAATLIVFPMLSGIWRGTQSTEIEVEDSARKDDHILAYVVTYFPPLFSLDLGRLPDLLSLAILYTTVAIIYVRLDAYYINPFLALAGYRVYEVNATNGNAYTVLAKRKTVVRKRAVIKGPMVDKILLSEGS